MTAPEFLVVGAGVSGVACARELLGAGRSVVVCERDGVGGRAKTAEIGGRPVDVGATYFTANVPMFAGVVEEWLERQLVVPWTDTFHVATPDGVVGTRSGPMRYIAPGGVRTLVTAMSEGLDVRVESAVGQVSAVDADGVSYAGVAVAVPSPQALAVLDESLDAEREAAAVVFDPCVVIVLEYADRTWAELDACFVNDSAVLTFVVDDGRRQGDDHPVLVAHTSSVLAAAHLSQPERTIDPVLAELRECLGTSADPTSVAVFGWPHAKPRHPSATPFFLGSKGVGLCGDAWHAPSRLESAYLSGRALGRAMHGASG